jgi:hypothetical protein
MKSLVQRNYLVLFLLLFSCLSFGQLTTTVSEVKIGNAKENIDLPFQVTLYQTSGISRVVLYYKTFGENEFKNQEMALAGTNVSTVIPGKNISPPYLEYYFKIDFADGKSEYYPQDYPSVPPIQIQVMVPSPKDNEVMILSPEPNNKILLNEFFVSISLLRASDLVNKAATKIYIDGTDVTSLALFADDVIMFYAENYPGSIQTGIHSLKVEIFDNSGSLYHSVSSDFEIMPTEFAQFSKSDIKYYINFKGESRNEDIRKVNNWYNNLTLNTGAELKGWNLDAKVYVTSEEKKYLQPNNRFLASLSSDFLKLSYGDDFPSLPNLVLNGKRVRGLYGDLKLGFFNLQVSMGEVTRGLDGKALAFYPKSLKVLSPQLGGTIVGFDATRDVEILPGTFQRKVFAIRPSFGSGENFQIGFSYLHGIDEKGSVEFATRPQENLVLGTDMIIAFDDQKFMITSQAAFSLMNSDISIESFTDEQIKNLTMPDSLFDGQESLLTNVRDYLGNFITVNQFLKPLNPQELATFAADASLQLGYFNNHFKLSYVYRGNDFQSFGQTLTRTDVAGINVTDRLRLLDNRLFLSVGYENLSDNLQKTKLSTTNYSTISTSISLFPRANFPNVILGYTMNKNKNDIDLPDTLVGRYNLIASIDDPKLKKYLYAVDDQSNRISAQISYDYILSVKQQTGLSVSISDRKDNSAINMDLTTLSLLFNTSTFWTDNFNSNVNLSMNNTKIESKNTANNRELNYFTLLVGGKYNLLKNQLILSGSLGASFGDLERRNLDFYSQYYILRNFSIALQFRLINQNIETVINNIKKSDSYNDIIFGLMTMFDL